MPAGVRARRSQTMSGSCAVDQHLRGFRNARPNRPAAEPPGRTWGCAALSAIGDRVLLQLGVEREEDRSHRRRGRNLVGAHRRLGEMLQRGRLVVPLGEVAHDRARCRSRNAPIPAPGAALVRLDDVAAHHDRPARGRTRRCTSPWWRAADRRRRGTPSRSACLPSWRSLAPYGPRFPRARQVMISGLCCCRD